MDFSKWLWNDYYTYISNIRNNRIRGGTKRVYVDHIQCSLPCIHLNGNNNRRCNTYNIKRRFSSNSLRNNCITSWKYSNSWNRNMDAG